jgi:hypothetical protein
MQEAEQEFSKDMLRGADEIADFLFGSASQRRKVYHLAATSNLPVFKLGSMICARRSVLIKWIADQEGKHANDNRRIDPAKTGFGKVYDWPNAGIDSGRQKEQNKNILSVHPNGICDMDCNATHSLSGAHRASLKPGSRQALPSAPPRETPSRNSAGPIKQHLGRARPWNRPRYQTIPDTNSPTTCSGARTRLPPSSSVIAAVAEKSTILPNARAYQCSVLARCYAPGAVLSSGGLQDRRAGAGKIEE